MLNSGGIYMFGRSRLMILLFFLCFAGMQFGVALADTFDWTTDDDGSWDDGGNWSTSSTTRTYPDDASDVANLNRDISADRTVSIPNAGISVNTLSAGDADGQEAFIISGGQLTTHSDLSFVNDATVVLDSDLSVAPRTDLAGDGTGSGETLVLNGTMDVRNTTGGVTVNSGLTLEMNSTVTGLPSYIGFGAGNGGTIACGFNGSLRDSGGTVGIASGGTLTTDGNDRWISDNVSFGQKTAYFDGSNGDLEIRGTTTFSSVNYYTSNIVNIEDGKLTLAGNINWNVHNAKATGQSPLTLDNGTLEITGTSNDYQVEADKNIDIRGSGDFVLNNSDGSPTGSGNSLLLASGVTLKGDGSTSSGIGLGGTINPGNSVGELAVGSTTFLDGSELIIELDGTGSDRLNVTGDLDLSSTADTLTIIGPSTTNNFTLATYAGSLVGEFDTVNMPAGMSSDLLSYGGNQITYTPEPGSGLLISLLVLAVLCHRKRL